MIMLKISIIIEDNDKDCEDISKIGEYLANDVLGTLYTGDDYIDVKYLGAEKFENLRI